MRAIRAMLDSGKLELYDLRENNVFLKLSTEGELPNWFRRYETLVNDAVRVSDSFHVDLKCPAEPTIGDHWALAFLKGLPAGVPIPVQDLTLGVTKIPETDSTFKKLLTTGAHVSLPLPEVRPRPVVFGLEVPTGAVRVEGSARGKDPEEFYRRLDETALGKTLYVCLEPIGPFHVRLAQEAPGDPS